MKKLFPENERKQITRVARMLKIHHRGLRECLAEFVGTAVLVIFITASSIQHVVSGSRDPTSAYLGGSIGVIMAFYVCGGVSGGAFNPAITLALCLTGKRPWGILLWHWVGQMLGAFLGAVLVFSIYTQALDVYDGGQRVVLGDKATASIFCSFPQDYLTTTQGFADSVLATGMLVFCALAIVDKRNMNVAPWFYPVAIGLLVFAIVSGFGLNSGVPINPAKDLGPRVFLLMSGWGMEVFSFRDYNWFWIPLIAPLVGSTIACFCYWLFIQNHWPGEEDILDDDDSRSAGSPDASSISISLPSEPDTLPTLTPHHLQTSQSKEHNA